MLSAKLVLDILSKAGVLDRRQEQLLRERVRALPTIDITRTIVELGYLTEPGMVGLLSQGLGVSRARLDVVDRKNPVLEKIPRAFQEKHQVLPLLSKENGRTLILAMADPLDLSVIDDAARLAGAKIQPALAGTQELSEKMRNLFHDKDALPFAPTLGNVAEMSLVLEPLAGADGPAESPPGPSEPSPPPQLQSAAANRERTSQVLAAVLELLVEKHVLDDEEARRLQSGHNLLK